MIGMSLLMITACKNGYDDSGEPGEDGTGGDEDKCAIDCPQGEKMYSCYIDAGTHAMFYNVCNSSISRAEDECIDDYPPPSHSVPHVRLHTCETQTADTNSQTWDPGAFVTYDSQTGVYEVDEMFLDSVLANPDQLLFDSARLEPLNPYYKFVDVQAGDFAYEVGFRTGDILLTVNSYPLSTGPEIFEAFDALENTQSFIFRVTRPVVGAVDLEIDLI
jgi:hypothetical protein